MSATEYYNHSTYPAQGASGSSAAMRAELELIETGFGKLPDLSGNGAKAVVINGGGTALSVTTGTLTLPGNFALSGANAVTLTSTGATNVTLPTSGTLLASGGALGTPASGVLTNCTGTAAGLTAGVASAVAVGGITGLGTGVGTALAIAVGSAGAPVVFNGAGGTPSSMTGTNISGTAANLTVGGVSFIPTGTKMLFQQTAAPTGWTKDTTHNDKALRVVSGTASSGGTSAFSTVFGKTATDSGTADLASHTHATAYTTVGSVLLSGGGATTVVVTGGSDNVTSTGAGGGHTHNMDIRVQYVDLIIATKD